MSWAAPQAAWLQGGRYLHLHQGPIDLIVSADTPQETSRRLAFDAAIDCFDGLLPALASELDLLRAPLNQTLDQVPSNPVAKRMDAAARRHEGDRFLTRMIAVAGSVADEVLYAMTDAAQLDRAFVNNGGDIALHLARHEQYASAIAGVDGRRLGRIQLTDTDRIGGIATSGAGGRSFSLGIADSVTVLAEDAAKADAAATLIANSINLPGHPAILRAPANSLLPDSDLGTQMVVTKVGNLQDDDVVKALGAGKRTAETMMDRGLIRSATLMLKGRFETVSDFVEPYPQMPRQ